HYTVATAAPPGDWPLVSVVQTYPSNTWTGSRGGGQRAIHYRFALSDVTLTWGHWTISLTHTPVHIPIL
ncbi:hypothetical protein BaRGS_00023097, partial [Batillaria attramentaria]